MYVTIVLSHCSWSIADSDIFHRMSVDHNASIPCYVTLCFHPFWVQAQNYDGDASCVSHWLPELSTVPRDKRHSVYNFTPSERAAFCPDYPAPIVKLKMGNFAGGAGQGGKGGGQRKGYQGGGKQGSKERKGKVYHF